jgi:ribosome-binding factor A
MEKKPSYRLSRAETQIMREIATLLEREIEDPRIKNVTIGRVSLSLDLRHAKIYFTLFAGDENKENIKKVSYALNHSVSYLRKRIAGNLKLRVIPELFFVYDNQLKEAEELIDIINKL